MKTKENRGIVLNGTTYIISRKGVVLLFLVTVALVMALQFSYGMTKDVLSSNKKLTYSLKLAQSDIKNFKDETNRKNNEIENLVAQYNSSDADLKSAKSNLDSTKSNLDSTLSNLDSTLSNLDKLKRTLKKQKTTLSKKDSELGEKDLEIKKMLKVQSKTDTRVADLEEQLNVVADSFGKYKEELDKEKQALSTKEKTLTEKEKVLNEEE